MYGGLDISYRIINNTTFRNMERDVDVIKIPKTNNTIEDIIKTPLSIIWLYNVIK